MTDIVVAEEAIYQAFQDGWGATSAFTFDNEKFDPPEDDKWVRVAIRGNDSNQETLGKEGNRRFERSGILFIQCFTPENQGIKDANTLAKTAREIFEGKRISGTTIYFLSGTSRKIGPDGKWYQLNVEIPFRYDETR